VNATILGDSQVDHISTSNKINLPETYSLLTSVVPITQSQSRTTHHATNTDIVDIYSLSKLEVSTPNNNINSEYPSVDEAATLNIIQKQQRLTKKVLSTPSGDKVNNTNISYFPSISQEHLDSRSGYKNPNIITTSNTTMAK
jgi:hypothetical protein